MIEPYQKRATENTTLTYEVLPCDYINYPLYDWFIGGKWYREIIEDITDERSNRLLA